MHVTLNRVKKLRKKILYTERNPLKKVQAEISKARASTNRREMLSVVVAPVYTWP